MAEHDCCPPGEKMPCDGEQGQTNVNIESAACCATSNLPPASVKAVGEQGHSTDGDLLLSSVLAAWAELPSFELAADSLYRWSGLDPPDIPHDFSRTYLQTARLRL
jgi:hypothetical protein